jgi:DNA-binding MarR family transcriptional regulator
MATKARQATPREPSLQNLLADASRRATADLRRVLGPKGVPVETWRVLEALADKRGRPMSALAEAVLMKLPSLSKLIDRMVASALVQRAPDQMDQRRVLVYISDLGLAKVRDLRRPVQRHLEAQSARLDERERRELRRLLQAFMRDRPS